MSERFATKQDVVSWKPYPMVTFIELEDLFDGRERIGIGEVLDSAVSSTGKIWLACHETLVGKKRLLRFGYLTAKRILKREVMAGRTPHPVLVEAIEAVKKFAIGEIPLLELEEMRRRAWAVCKEIPDNPREALLAACVAARLTVYPRADRTAWAVVQQAMAIDQNPEHYLSVLVKVLS